MLNCPIYRPLNNNFKIIAMQLQHMPNFFIKI